MLSIKLPKEQKEEIVRSVQAYFEEERSESIGQLAAEQLIDLMISELEPYIYNKAIEDTRMMITGKMAQIDDELYALEKPLRNRR